MQFPRYSQFQYFVALGLILVAIGLVLQLTGKTVLTVDQLACRNYYPWKAIAPPLDCSKERDGDYIFESHFIASELDYLSSNPYQHTYSERIMNGYPIAAAYTGNPYTLTRLFNKFFSPPSSANYVAIIYIFVGFTLGYLLARALNFDYRMSLVFGFFCITSSYVLLNEAYNMALVGFEMMALGLLMAYLYSRRYAAVALMFVGAMCIMLSAFFQLYLYAAVSMGVLALLVFWVREKRKYLIALVIAGICLAAAALVLHTFLEQHLSFLEVSQKTKSQLSLTEFLKHKDYAMDPIGWIGYEPPKMHHKIVALLFGDKVGYGWYGGLSIGSFSPGPVFLILFFLGAFALWKTHRAYVLFSIFWLLYFAGYMQLLLSALPGPFRIETSVRASNLFFLSASFAVVYALRERKTLEGRTKWVAVAVCTYLVIALPVFAVFRNLNHGQVMVESLAIALSALLFMVWIWKPKLRAFLVVALIFPSFARFFLGATPDTITLNDQALYYPRTEFGDAVTRHPEISRVALIETPGGNRTHTNGPVMLGLGTITGYRNPMYEAYVDLYWKHKLAFEGSTDPNREADELKTSVDYLNNGLPALKAPSSSITLQDFTLKYFELTRTNGIIGSEDLSITNPDWERVVLADGLSLWRYNKRFPEFSFDGIGTLSLISKTDGYRLLQIDTPSGGNLLLPVTYDKHWLAMMDKKRLEIFASHGPFLGVIVPPGKGTLEIRYRD